MAREIVRAVMMFSLFFAGSTFSPIMGQEDDSYYAYRQRAKSDDSYYAQFDSAARAANDLSRSFVLIDTAAVDTLAYARAERAFLARDYARAEKYLADYTTRFASSPRSRYMAEALLMLGKSQIALGLEEEGTYNVERAAAEGNPYVTAQANGILAPLYEKRGDLLKAYEAYMGGVASADTPTALYEMRRKSVLLAVRLDDQEKILMATEAMIVSPGVPEGLAQFARYQRAYALMKLGRLDEAYEVFSLLGKGNKTEAGAECRYRMVEILLMKGEYDRVKNMTIWAAQQDKGSHDYWIAKGYLAMARALLAQGNTLEARQTLNSLVRGYAVDDDGIRAEAEEGLRAVAKGQKDW